MWEIVLNFVAVLENPNFTKNYSDLSLFEQIVLVISNFLQILGLQPRISKFFLTVGQNNFGNKIPFRHKKNPVAKVKLSDVNNIYGYQ